MATATAAAAAVNTGGASGGAGAPAAAARPAGVDRSPSGAHVVEYHPMASTAEALLRVAKDRGLLDETDSDDDDDGDSAGATMRRSKVPPPEQVKWVGFFTERYVPNMSNLLGVGEIILPTAHSKKSLETTARRAAVKELRRIQDPQQRDEKRPVVWVRWVGDLRSRVTVGRAVTEPADAHLCRPLPHTPIILPMPQARRAAAVGA